MTNTQRQWTPKSPMTETQRSALTVEANRTQKMNRDLFLSLLDQKISKLMKADPATAQEAMLASEEYAPEMYSIASNHPMKDWPTLLVNSEAILPLLRKINWELENQPGERPLTPEPIDLSEMLELMM